MSEVNWTVLNARLCEALKVHRIAPDCRCYEAERVCDCPWLYPNILSVDALLPLLAALPGIVSVGVGADQPGMFLAKVQKHFRIRRECADTPGRALSLTAAAALGVEVPQC